MISLDGQRRSVNFIHIWLILQKYQFHDKIVVGTKNEKVITNPESSLAEVEMSDCSQPEADSRIIPYVSSCIQIGLINVYVRTNDIDVVVLLIAFMSDFLKNNARAQLIVAYGKCS